MISSVRFLTGLVLTAHAIGCATEDIGPGKTREHANTTRGVAASGSAGHRVVVLGTAQDGGLPHPACGGPNCTAARHDPSRARHTASLGIVLEDGTSFLVDASPSLEAQLELLRPYRGERSRPGLVDRAPIDGVLLTHAHIGHYLGLAFFGFETVSTTELPVYATPRMAAFLRAHEPWRLMVERRNIALRETPPGESFELAPGIEVTPLQVPHRDELSDTVGFKIRGPRQTILYVPDTDRWATWSPPLAEVLKDVDVALLDATFYSLDELPGRDINEVPHPLITTTMDLLEARVSAGSLRVLFTHLNHSNPALDPDGAPLRALRVRGFDVAEDGMEIEL